MRHLGIADDIRDFLLLEQYDKAEALLPAYARAVTEECITARDEVAFTAARDFVQRTLVELRARRVHLGAQIADLHQTKPYLTRTMPQTPGIDCLG